jgi:uncharacterized membrane protein YheB (UPF0754 family)
MEQVKKELKESYQRHLREGLSEREALSKAILEVSEKHEPEKFSRALQEFLKELLDSYKPENLAEADPLIAFVESLYEEFELLKPVLESFLKRLKKEK